MNSFSYNAIMGRVNKFLFLISFFTYFFVMSYVYYYYKNRSPAFDSTLTENVPYLIDTEGYKLPDYDPFDTSIVRYLEKPPFEINCNDGKRDLTRGISNFKSENSTFDQFKSVILIQDEFIEDYNVKSFTCCYQGIKREADNEEGFKKFMDDPMHDYPDLKFFVEKECHTMNSKITEVSEQGVLVTCDSNFITFYKNIHLYVPLNSNEVKRLEYKENPLNVFILGLDSVSRLNMQRYMPQTFNYLKLIDAVDLKGFNKMFENTLPNLLSILTGLDYTQDIFWEYMKRSDGYFNDLPFIWKNFSNAGYTTLYGEDCTSLGTFSYNYKKGFKSPPTDYYFRPYIKAAEDILGSNKGVLWFCGCKFCAGNKLLLQHILDYAEDVATSFGHTSPYFSFLWSTSLTHDRLSFTSLTDKPVLRFLKNMHENNYFNNTIVLFMSDHGIRFGSIRETYIGKKEESLPFSFILLPKWFKKKYSAAYENLLHNQNKLTTTLDLHKTLIDILNQNYNNNEYLSKEHDIFEHGVSLFRKISGSRNCFDAGIPINYCAGQLSVSVPTSPIVRLAASYIMEILNRDLKEFPECVQISGFIIRKSYLLKFFENESKYLLYDIQMSILPSDAIIEGIVKVRTNENSYKMKVMGDLSRINSYGNQSYCINDSKYEKYCLCKTLL